MSDKLTYVSKVEGEVYNLCDISNTRRNWKNNGIA